MERRRFTREFKLEAVRLIKERGVSYTQASQDLGLDRYGNSRYGQSWPETGPISLGQRRDQLERKKLMRKGKRWTSVWKGTATHRTTSFRLSRFMSLESDGPRLD